MIRLSDDEARSLSILLNRLSDGDDEAAEWSEKLWDRRRFDTPDGPESVGSREST